MLLWLRISMGMVMGSLPRKVEASFAKASALVFFLFVVSGSLSPF